MMCVRLKFIFLFKIIPDLNSASFIFFLKEKTRVQFSNL
jgi:hypothetical protein